MIFPNHYIASLARAEQRRGDTNVSPTRDRRDGFIEIAEEEPQEQPQVTAPEVCPLSPAQLRDAGAVTATVMETTPDSCFIDLTYHIGGRKRRTTAFCTYADRLSVGDELVILVREVGQQTIVKIMGLRADRKEVAHE